MPQIPNYNNVEAGLSDGFKQVEPGRYVLRVQAVRTEWDEYNFDTGLVEHCTTASHNAVQLVYDIADGEFAAEYSKDFYMSNGMLDPKKDFLHQYKLWWGDLTDPKDAGAIKALLEKFTASNNGFDAYAAFSQDQWGFFVGKLFGVVLNGTVKTNDKGFDNWNLRPARRIYTPAEIQAGTYTNEKGETKDIPAPRINDKRTKVDEANSASVSGQNDQPPTSVYDDDLPF